MRELLCAALLLALAACGPKAPEQSSAPTPAASVAAAPSEPSAPAGPPRLYDPLSKTAMAFTDTLEASDLPGGGLKLITGNGHVYEFSFAARTQANAAIGDGPWTNFLTVPLDTPVQVYKVTSESVNAKAPNGGFCAPDATTYLGVAEYATPSGEREMQMAAFKGEGWPPAESKRLCGTFSYIAKTGG